MSMSVEIPVYHLENKELGRGLIVGDFQTVTPKEDGSGVIQNELMKVIWENVSSPCPSYHSPKELVNAYDFDSMFGDDDEDDEDDEDEDEDGDNDEIEEGEVLASDDSQVHIPEVVGEPVQATKEEDLTRL